MTSTRQSLVSAYIARSLKGPNGRKGATSASTEIQPLPMTQRNAMTAGKAGLTNKEVCPECKRWVALVALHERALRMADDYLGMSQGEPPMGFPTWELWWIHQALAEIEGKHDTGNPDKE